MSVSTMYVSIPVAENENERIEALRSLKILDTEPDENFDRITRFAKNLLNVPIALVSLVDSDRQWFKSCIGLDTRETDRGVSFCSRAILQDKIMVIEDATKNPIFAQNSLVTGPPQIRFYAGVPIHGPGNYPIGTLCVIDLKPRLMTNEEKKSLEDLAKWVEVQLNLKYMNENLILENWEIENELLKKEQEILNHKNAELKKELEVEKQKIQYSAILSHELRTPIASIMLNCNLLEAIAKKTPNQNLEMIKDISRDMKMLNNLVDDAFDLQLILANSFKVKLEKASSEEILSTVKILTASYLEPKKIRLQIEVDDFEIYCDERRISQVLINLIRNAVDFSTKEGVIIIKAQKINDCVYFTVKDFGEGIPEDKINSIFKKFYQVDTSFTRSNGGTGLGLFICQKIIESHNGEISVESDLGKGTTFTFSIPIMKN